MTTSADIQLGDKVRVKDAVRKGERGAVRSFDGNRILVAFDSGEVVSVTAEQLTNLSSAARRA
jgi:hypothetical protein